MTSVITERVGQCPDLHFSAATVALFSRRFEAILIALGFESAWTLVQGRWIEATLIAFGSRGFAQVEPILDSSGIRRRWNRVLQNDRSATIAASIRPYVHGSVLDLLCGAGDLAAALRSKELDFMLCERYVPSVLRHKPFQFVAFQDIFRELADVTFDTILLSTVLHHEYDPDSVLHWAGAHARRLILIENAIDADNDAEYQMLVDIFFNHCLNVTGAPSPGSHRTLHEWEQACTPYGDISVTQRLPDVPGVPLSHVLLIVEWR